MEKSARDLSARQVSDQHASLTLLRMQMVPVADCVQPITRSHFSIVRTEPRTEPKSA